MVNLSDFVNQGTPVVKVITLKKEKVLFLFPIMRKQVLSVIVGLL